MRIPRSSHRSRSVALALSCLLGAGALACGPQGSQELQPAGGQNGASTSALMKQRSLAENDVIAALKTYTPTGVHDPYYIFASGGHSGQVIVIGLPSMRILKVIAVFTPEPW